MRKNLSRKPNPSMELLVFQNGVTRKRRKLEGDDGDRQQETTAMEFLPREIILDIFSRLPITSLVQFKFVCRGWRILAQGPLVLDIDNNTSQNPDKNPCLILHCDFPIRNHLYFIDFSVQENDKQKVRKFYTPFQANLPEFDVVGSCNGLLCLSDFLYKDAIYIYNPFTINYIELPKSVQYPDQEIVFGFGIHPGTKQYKVVKIVYYRKSNGRNQRARRIIYSKSDVQVYTVGSLGWRSLGKVSYQFLRRSSEALIKGRLHWVTMPRPARRIISFDLSDEKFREVLKPDCGGLNRCNFHLAVLRGCLSAAVYGNYGKLEIWVMKEYNVKESWVKEYTIGSYMPKGLKQNLDCPIKIWKNAGGPGSRSGSKVVRVLCLLENGEVLLEYKGRVLVCYDPKKGKFKDLTFPGMPNCWFQATVHVGNFNWINTSSNDI